MNPSTFLVLLLQSSVVLTAALLTCFLAKRSPSLRVAVTRVSLLATAGLVILLPWLGKRESPVVPIEWTPPQGQVALTSPPPLRPTNSAGVPAPGNKQETGAATISQPDPVAKPSTPVEATQIILAVWALGVAVLTARLALGYRALAKIRASAVTILDPRVYDLLGKSTGKSPRIVESDVVGVPFVAGILKPTIYLPKGWVKSETPETVKAVLCHEQGHIQSGDLRWSLLYQVLQTVLWPQPLLWLLRKPMISACEELCDQYVVNSGISSERYADCLLNLRDSLALRSAPAFGIGAVSTRSLLGKRIEALMDAHRNRSLRLSKTVSAMTKIGAFGIAAGATVIFARPLPQAPADDPMKGWLTTAYDTRIRVLDRLGRPIPGKIEAFLLLQGESRQPKTQDLEVRSGEILVDAKSLDHAFRGDLIVKAPNHALYFQRLWPVPTPVEQIQLEAPTSVNGKVLLPDGKPAAGLTLHVATMVRQNPPEMTFARLDASGPSRGISVTTGPDGGYSIKGLPSKVSVRLAHTDRRFGMLTFKQELKTPEKGEATMPVIQLELGANFSGRVVKDGKPVSGIIVGAQENHAVSRDSRGDWAEAVTDAQGRYTLYGLGPTAYNVALDLDAKLSSEYAAPAHEGVVGKPGETITGVDFFLTPGAIIHGQVVDKDGKPFPYTHVGIYGPAHPDSSAWVQSVKTDAAGKYRACVPPGRQRVYWMDGQGGKINEVNVSQGTVTELDIDLGNVSQGSAPSPNITSADTPLAAGPSKEAKKVASFGKGGPAYGPFRLKNGAVVSLAFVQDDSLGPRTIWQPDGSAATPADRSRSLDMGGSNRRPGEPRRLYARIDVEGVARGNYYCRAQLPYSAHYTVWQTYGELETGRSMDMATFQAPDDLLKTDLRFGVAAGPFRPLAKIEVGRRSQIPFTIDTPRDSVAVIGGPMPDVEVIIEVPPAMDSMQMEMKAFDVNGKALQSMTISPYSEIDEKTGKRTRSFLFSGATPSEVTRLELGVRDFEWVTFKGIRLYPK